MKYYWYIFLFLLSFTGCKNREKEGDTLSGKIQIASDASFFPLLNAEAKIFQYLYKNAEVLPYSTFEAEAIQHFMEGKADMALVSRDISVREREALKQVNIHPQVYTIAVDALVLIVNKERSDSSLALTQLKKILSGDITQWQQLGSSVKGDIILAFDLNNSSNLLSLHHNMPLRPDRIKVFATGSDQKVIEYVQQHREAIGIIGLGLISDNPNSNQDLKRIKILSLEGYNGQLYTPWQEDLGVGKYPLRRQMYLWSRYKTGLGTGFASFILSEDGQRIVLKSGLLPVKMPGREVIFNK